MTTAGPQRFRAGWFVPTVRARRPAMLTLITVVVLYVVAVSAASWFGAAVPDEHTRFALAASAAAAVWPHDPAANLLAALPTGAGRRLARRVALGLGTALTCWLPVASIAPGVGPGDSFAGLVVLTSVALAAAVPCRTWGAVTPLALVGASQLVGTGRLADLATLWWRWPWWVTIVAFTAVVGQYRRSW